MLEFYSLPLGYAGWKEEEIAFMYLGNSGVILRTRKGPSPSTWPTSLPARR
jgi:hypothetical protein